ncbi:hypothetical protein ACHAXS_006007 [Conticribra weissflogii]
MTSAAVSPPSMDATGAGAKNSRTNNQCNGLQLNEIFLDQANVGSGNEAPSEGGHFNNNAGINGFGGIHLFNVKPLHQEIDAVATTAYGYQVKKPRPPLPLQTSQLERDLKNIASGKSGSAYVAVTRQNGLASSFISAVSLPLELLEDGLGENEAASFGDGEIVLEKFAKEYCAEEKGLKLEQEFDDYDNHDNGNDVPHDFIISLKGGQVPDSNCTHFRQQRTFDEDIPLNDFEIKSLKSSMSNTNLKAIEVIIDLKMQLAQASATKDELNMKLKKVSDEKSEIEKELAGILREKLRFDELFKEHETLKKMNRFQQQQTQQHDQNDSRVTLESDIARNPRPVSGAVTSEFSNSLSNSTAARRLTALVSELKDSTRDLMNHETTENHAETSPKQPSHGHKNSVFNSSLRSLRLRRSSSFFSGSFSAIFSEAAVCPMDDNNQQPISPDSIQDDSKKRFHFNTSSTNSSAFGLAKPTCFATSNGTFTDPASSTEQGIISLMEENIQLIRNNTNLSSEIYQLKKNFKMLKKEFKKILEDNHLTTTSIGTQSVDANVMALLYNDGDDSGRGSPVNSAVGYEYFGKQGVRNVNIRGSRARVRSCSVGSQYDQWKHHLHPRPQLHDCAGKEHIADMRRFKNISCNNNDDDSRAKSESSDVDGSISIGDDSVEKKPNNFEKKLLSFSSLLLDSENRIQTCPSDVDITPYKEKSDTAQQCRRPEFKGNDSLPRMTFFRQDPSCKRSLSSRGLALTRTRSFKVSAGNVRSDVEYRKSSVDSYKQSSLRRLHEAFNDCQD